MPAFFADRPERAPTLNKLPLVRWRRGFVYVNSTHSMLPARLNDAWDGPGDPRLSGALLHTKFLPEIVAKSAIERTRRQHFHDPDAFDDYYAALGANPDLWHPGAARLVAALKENGCHCVLVSGGFTFFTERLARELGFDEAHANVLETKDGLLTGRLVGPVIDAAAKALAAAGDDAAKKAAAQAALDAVNLDSGLVFQWGAIDFAGGTVVHINSGIAGLMGALIVGKRTGFGKELMPPHSLVMTMIGASLLWVGWFGFNAGSNLEATGGAPLAMINSFIATAGAALSWMFAEWIIKGKPSLLGLVSGCVAGLVAVTPASGYAGPMGALVLGLIVGVVCLFFVSTVKNMFGYDDALDVFGVHCIGGIVGAIGTGILVAPALGGTGIMDYTTGKIADYDFATQVWAQTKAVLMTLVWSGVGSAILYKVVDFTVGLRPSVEKEREGLDLTDHGERAYNM